MNNTEAMKIKITILLLVFSMMVMAQTTSLKVTGVVTSTNSKSGQTGARISVVGEKQVAMTDEKGIFNIEVPSSDACLVVTAPDCEQQTVYLKGRSNISIHLLSAAQEPVDKMNFAGEALSIRQNGEPGSETNLFINGLHSINISSQPLYVVDGVVWQMQEDAATCIDGYTSNPLNLIDADDIEHIEVSKNGSAIWGAKAAAGVVYITTKRASNMATKIEANISMGMLQKFSSLPMMDASEYKRYATDIVSGLDKSVSSRLLFMNDDKSRLSYFDTHNATDWMSLINKNAMLQNYGINVAGGDEKALYRFSLGYAQNDGNIKGSTFNRLNVRFNSDIFLTSKLSVSSDIYYANTNSRVPVSGISDIFSPYYLALAKSPLYSPYQRNALGELTNRVSDVDELNITNPIAIIGDLLPQTNKQRFSISLKPRYVFTDRFSLIALLAFNWDKENQDRFTPDAGVTNMPLLNTNGEQYAVGLNEVQNLMARQNTLSADLHFDWTMIESWKHSLKTLGGVRLYNDTYKYTAGKGYNTGSDFMKALSNTNSSLRWILGDSYTARDLAWYLQSDYSFMQRYGLNVSAALQASSRYGKNTDGLSLAGASWMPTAQTEAYWNISSESFMQNLKSVDAKLKAGWSLTGNDRLPINASRTYQVSSALSQNAIGNVIANIGNDKLKWESTNEIYAGLDLSLFNKRWDLVFDVYRSTTSNLISRHSMAEESGLTYYWANGGKMQNTGFNLSTQVRIIEGKDMKLSAGAMVAHYKNEITELPSGSFHTDILGAQVLTAVGQPVGVFYGYQTNGVYSKAEDATAAGLGVENANGSITPFGAGDMIFVDNKKDGVINDLDRVVIGNPNPDFYGSFNFNFTWKQLTITPLFSFSVGGDIYNALRADLESGSSLHNQTKAALNRWTADGQTTLFPRATYGDPMGNSRFSDRWIEDGSYLRFKSVMVSYDIPFKSSMLQNIKVWASVNNVFTLTKYLGADPETAISTSVLSQGIDGGVTPQSRSFVVGVKVNL